MPFNSDIKDIEARISSLEMQLVHLKRRRNGLLPICRLPSELLVDILRHLQNEPGSEDKRERLKHDLINRKWSRIMLVCYHFRTLAVNTPSLWDTLDSSHPLHWRYLCLLRAADAPLCVRLHDEDGGHLLERAWKAEIDGLEAVQAVDWNAPRPGLQHLAIRLFSQGLRVTPEFLGAVPVALVHLELIGWEIALEAAPRMPCLRFLEMRQVDIPNGFESLFSLFRNVPMVEELRIARLYFGDSMFGPNPNTIIPIPEPGALLPCLKTLRIEEAPPEASGLVRMLHMPSTAFGVHVLARNPSTHKNLNANHLAVYEAYLTFISSMPDAADFSKGSITEDPSVDLRTIHFGRTAEGERNMHRRLSLSACFFAENCAPNVAHPLLDYIHVMRVLKNVRDGRTTTSIHLLPHVHTLVLCKLIHPDFWDARTWFKERKGRFQRVELRDCYNGSQEFAARLRQEQLVPDVVWYD
jgi:hypothetical protein